ncbi:MAG TPA: lipoyl synthase [Bacteroidota bacterium]|jgi:lipoic acid synthetase|nr:lipoyl synthase [Bacteroidota bacterium]
MEYIIQELPSPQASADLTHRPRPEWLKARIPGGEHYARLKDIIDSHQLHTVCQEARCPNMGECWNHGTATFMILGDVCTRSCGFCAVKTGKPLELDAAEPLRVAGAVKLLGLRHAVITSVNRDELYDGGAQIFAETIRQVRELNPETRIEVLIPDFKGEEFALNMVLDALPDILNHNTETVPRLYDRVRPQAQYRRSLQLLDRARRRGFLTKTGLMLGLGEEIGEVVEVMNDLRDIGCEILTLGQYLQPTKGHLPVVRFVHPDEFRMLKETGLSMGFRHVESGPLVRSSYHAEQQLLKTLV